MLAKFIKWVIAVILALIGIDYSPDREKESDFGLAIYRLAQDFGDFGLRQETDCQYSRTSMPTAKAVPVPNPQAVLCGK